MADMSTMNIMTITNRTKAMSITAITTITDRTRIMSITTITDRMRDMNITVIMAITAIIHTIFLQRDLQTAMWSFSGICMIIICIMRRSSSNSRLLFALKEEKKQRGLLMKLSMRIVQAMNC